MTNPKNSEEAFIFESTSGSEVVVTRDNCALYTYIAEAALYDHVFITYDGPDDRTKAIYIFRHISPQLFDDMKTEIEERNFKQILFIDDAAEEDKMYFDSNFASAVDREAAALYDE